MWSRLKSGGSLAAGGAGGVDCAAFRNSGVISTAGFHPNIGTLSRTATATMINSTPQAETSPGQVAASLRQIAVTSENLTLELIISAQNPIKNVTVTLRAGDYQDVRQTFIPTSQGSVPFLVPISFASAGIFYEVKDEAQRVLASGSSDLRSLGK